MQFRRQSSQEETINLTPLIDVVFLLLIFFMVSTTFTKESHLQIALPEAAVEPTEVVVDNSVDIVISANGDYSVNGNVLVNQQAATLLEALRPLAQQPSQVAVNLTADADTSHQAVVTAMDVAGQLGFSEMRITTQEPVADNP